MGSCDYRFARSRGIPPADCNSITLSWIDEGDSAPFGDCESSFEGCEDVTTTAGIRIALTRICMGPDQEPVFDWELEDAAAACFSDDLEKVMCCLKKSDWRQLKQDHRLDRFTYVGTTYDVESQGGGYSAYIEMTIVAPECCELPV